MATNHTSVAAAPPRFLAWVVERRLAISERLGGGGRSHRRVRREQEQEWCRRAGLTDLVSGLTTRHGLVDYGLAGFSIHWFPLGEPELAGPELRRLVQRVEGLLRDDRSAVVHVDRPNGWLAGVDAALRLGLRVAGDADEALLQAARDGLPVDPTAERLLAGYAEAASAVKIS